MADQHLDWDFSQPVTPFQPAGKSDRRLKLFLWGDTGTHKTILSIQFPHPVVIDLEKGTELYGNDFKFDRMDPMPSNAEEVQSAVNWLATNKHPYRTLVIDPITVFWEMLQKKWSDIFLKRNQTSRGFKHEFYDFQPRDWMTIKDEWKELLRRLIRLDMNVIVTARQKAMYAEGEMMRRIGVTFDGEKALPYLFDTNLQLEKRDGKYFAKCHKDRSHHFEEGKDIENPTYSMFESLFGKEELSRKAKPEPVDPAMKRIRDERNKAIADYIKELGIPEDKANAALVKYNAKTIEELSDKNAEAIESQLEMKVLLKRKSQPLF